MDAGQRYCQGCRRTLDEIASWSQMTDEEKRAVLAQLPQRGNISGPRISE
jgi:predicted Fe-S protein YdhL (DUF1289 family)